MIAPAGSSSLISGRVGPADPLDRISPRLGPAATLLLGFLTFMPYPSLTVGGNSALQMGSILTLLLMIPALAMPWRHRPIFLYVLIFVPIILSAVNAAVTGADDIDLCVKSIPFAVVVVLTLIPTQLYAPRYPLHLLTGIAAATVVHAAVGFWQLYCFSNGEFPFANIYVNVSFMSVQDNADVIAKYVQRPFGLFPEPSAMSSSLAPWILFWVAEVTGVVRLREQPARWQRVLFACAACGGLLLIILSASAHMVATLAGLTIIALYAFRRMRATPRSFAIVVPILGLLVPLMIYLATTAMSGRVEHETTGGGSWDERSTSLVMGFELYAHGDLATLIFGMGIGLAPPALWNAAHVSAICSVLLTYLYESGLVGVAMIAWITVYMLRVWRASGLDVTFAVMSLLWLFGITVTTSYAQLLPVWVTMGWLSVWPAICEPAGTPRPRHRILELPLRSPSPVPRRLSWTAPQLPQDATKGIS
jgi:hypothetical protein